MNSTFLIATCLLLADSAAPIDFDRQVIPVLTKAGCNTGACHGAAVGRGGFKLSLYGGDPTSDYDAIARESNGRRVNLAKPDESLIVLKPTESLEHGGGERLPYDGPGAELLRQWVRDGARRNRTADSPSLQRLKINPQRQVIEVGQTLALSATAEFSDGEAVDVTRWTVFTAEDPSALSIDPLTAIVKVARRGRHIVVARYLSLVVAVEIIAPLSDQPLQAEHKPDAAQPTNFIDRHINELLSTLRVPCSPRCDDGTFMRRVALDLTGRLPRPSDLKAFVDDANPDKRATLVDQLLQSREFEEFWAFKWSQLLRIRSQPGDTVAAKTYYKWLREQVAKKTPYDQFAQQLLVSVGDTRQHGPANFYRTVGNAREQAEFASELWMGSRLRCANCHNHPLDRWTQDDYHGLAAIFAKLKRGQVIAVSNSGEVTHPRTGAAAIPRIPGADFLTENASNGRELLADWLTAPENPYFAKAAVNRMWKVMMGRGLVEPTDDFRATNPATHPALLEELATDFVANGYQWRHTLRRIALSDAYSRSAQTLAGNGADDRYYSHMLTRPLEAELLADAIADVTGVAEPYGEHPLGTRAIAVFDAKVPSLSLDILGRCSREESCESTDGAAGGLSRKLHLLNGPLLNRRINHAEGRLKAMLDAGISEMNIVDAFYELALSRSPSESEREFWKAQLHAVENPQQQQILEDFVWGLLNCREFVTHH